MNKLDPIEQSKYIENEFREYIKDTFHFKDNDYQKQFEKELDNQVLYKGPFLSASLPFSSGKSINELIKEGKMSSLFSDFNKVVPDRSLYIHQEQAFNKIINGRSVVVTTGTGSGKTECYLYPILESILREIENGTICPGVRAMFLYPMNALVNDQIDRVRKILKDFPEITFGFYTGDTPKKESGYDGEGHIENEIVSREAMRENPPHLLFTNYSMLEYMMIRPDDYRIFNPEYIKNWRYVVLDEAHTYRGALGIEMALLLRRVTGQCEKKPSFILTSATLGDKGKDEKDIIEFAEALTNTKYDVSDIIFSTRDGLDYSEIQYTIHPSTYIELDENLNNMEKIVEIASEYQEVKATNVPEIVYDLLKKDSNIYYLYGILQEKSVEYKEVFNKLKDKNFKEEKCLTSLIHLLNIARKNKKFIYDIKYHTFVKTLSGAYVSLAPNKQLSLIPRSWFNDMKAFEFGTCRFCNAPYIFGKNYDNKLIQNNDVDIYENYGDDETFNANLDYYLLYNDNEIEDMDLTNCEKYTICSKCGQVYDSGNLNSKKCDCGKIFAINVLKVNTSDMKNNITSCPCCSHSSNRGVVRSVSMGKDEATAILGQILYKSIEKKEQKEVKTEFRRTFSLSTTPISKEPKKEQNVKQFLAFSDSRQQASFFAKFFEENHMRFLRKRIIWEVIKNENFESIDFSKLITRLQSLIKTNNLFDNENNNIEKQAWISALYELLNVDGDYSAEGLGLFYFRLKAEDYIGQFGEDVINDYFGKYGINKTDLENLLRIVFDTFRTSAAINYDDAPLTSQEKKDEFQYRRFSNSIKLKKQITAKSESRFKEGGNIKSFLPVTGKNTNLEIVKKICKCSTKEALEILEVLFQNVGVETKLFSKTEFSAGKDEAYQISCYNYTLENYKNSKYYICKKCGRITPYNVHNYCVNADCDGKLEIIEPDDYFSHNYYRKQYLEKDIEKIEIKEHTAQLSSKTAKEYQNKFKDKEINILSCSTTFEMGVDIGDLETVFMRNVPPSPANYVQRAGRAGRSDDSSAFVLTFCGTSSHDYTYYSDPNKMISGKITPPKFSITNEKIIIRHLLAASLGFFFRKNKRYIDNMDEMIFNGGSKEFIKYLRSEPDDLNAYINNKILDEKTKQYKNFKWLDNLNGESIVSKFEDNVKDLVNDFEQAKELALSKDELGKANYFKYQIGKIKKENSVISELSHYGVIPKYGFPVDVVDLTIMKNGVKDESYRLQRDLKIAISEYAPESEIIVEKEKYTSRYIEQPSTGPLLKRYYAHCDICDRTSITYTPSDEKGCKYCGYELEYKEHFIVPERGFKTGENKESTTKKPKKTYAGAVEYIGNGKKDDKTISIGNNDIVIETSSDDQLLVINKNDFFMCPVCGYTKIVKNKPMNIPLIQEHLNANEHKCICQELEGTHIGHVFSTDVAKISIKGLYEKNNALSLLYALLEGISNTFDIERKDIDGLIVKNNLGAFDIIIYDNVPGGAGHVKRIVEKDKMELAFKAAYEKVSQNCCDENTSCYNCLRNYNNQKFHERLTRKGALIELEDILKMFE